MRVALYLFLDQPDRHLHCLGVGSETQPWIHSFAELGEVPWISMVQSSVSCGSEIMVSSQPKF